MRCEHFGMPVAGIVGLLMVCGTALGQNALGDGRALDAGLHATQGRLNPKAPGINDQLRFNNAVIYGTAPNGKSFQGYVGYRAPNQFEGPVGSDALYNFRRDSFTSGLAGAGVRGSDALRYQFSLTTGQYVPGFLAAPPTSVPREGTVATGANSTSTSAALRSTSEFLTGQSMRPSLVGVKQDEWGAEYVAKASPLLGVRWVQTAESPLGTSAPAAPGAVRTPAGPPGVPTNAVPPQPTGKPEPGRLQPGLTGLETSANGVGNVLDNAVDMRVPPISFKATSAMHQQLLTRVQEGFNEPRKPGEVGPKPAPEAKTFEEQLDLLHRRMRGEPDQIEKPAPMISPDGSTPRPTEPGKPEKPGAKPGDDKGASRGGDEKSGSNIVSPEMAKALKKSGETKVEHLVSQLPPPDKEHGDAEGYRQLMREGEKMLATGRFFDAEERFTRAIASQARDPMARIGRVHAEIGAGLYLSAAANLRGVFADHPELIGTKYSPTLLPTEARAKTILEQLGAEEKKSESLLGRESALLLAYMGYQRGDAALVKQGLADLDNRIVAGEAGMEDRALLSVVRAAWTEK